MITKTFLITNLCVLCVLRFTKSAVTLETSRHPFYNIVAWSAGATLWLTCDQLICWQLIQTTEHQKITPDIWQLRCSAES